MFPIRDTIQSRTYPVVNWIIIALNTVLFFVEIAQGDAVNEFIFTYGIVPARYSVPAVSYYFTAGQQFFSFFSFMFLHGGFLHLLGNMWFLFIFGDNVEDRIGHSRYILFYFLCGWASGLTHIFFNYYSSTPTIGASGAIAGVMGAYFLLFPRAKIVTLIPILFIPYFIELPAAIFLGLWLFFQFISATLAGSVQAGGIAWWAHIGGFLFGAIFLKLFRIIPALDLPFMHHQNIIRRSSPRFQTAKPMPSSADSRVILGTVFVTENEAVRGTRKLLNIPHGFRNRLLRIEIPPGIRDGDIIRLNKADETSKDLYLRVKIQSAGS